MERRLEVQHEPETKLVVMLDYLRGLGLSMEDCGRVVSRNSGSLGSSIEKTDANHTFMFVLTTGLSFFPVFRYKDGRSYWILTLSRR